MEEKTLVSVVESEKQSFTFSRAGSPRADSPSRRVGLREQVISTVVKTDDLEELDDDEEGDEVVQETETPVDDSDTVNDAGVPASNQYPLWTMDWCDLDQERRSFKKRRALDDLPEDVREELASMSGADFEVKPKRKAKLEPSDTFKESSRGRKSPTVEEGVSDISNVLSKPTKTPEERLAVLEARDKLIRIRNNQQLCTQLKNVGKCPDMCPEKERYQRIARHQVDNYEYNKETKEVNHACMVKIYARSSADQQMPLPHDLRPVNVLWMTMSYLVNQFMDLADSPGENLGDWYHFLWDRMRSIRKDITQLALCDTLSVQILEMCARFHIFCMERLREEKMAVFDEKINRENLTKCLQSLQYMYNDLFLKNISCPNEPEFQAYSILLHINSDLCTSTILGLRSEMRQHKKVQFAINAFLAVTMKNYVRFFKLVKLTTYLNACILHQYFAQVRAHAMHSIIRAYSRQKMRNTYPLAELQAQLLFDSIDDVLEFCRVSKVFVEDNNIVLEKKTSHPIPMQEKMKRSFAGVECKRQSSIREIVAGGCCLANTATFHEVHDSFDNQGILKQEAWYAEDQETSSLVVGMMDKKTLSKTFSESSSFHHVPAVNEESQPGEGVSSITSSPFNSTQILPQNSRVPGSQILVFKTSNSSSSLFNKSPVQSAGQTNAKFTSISEAATGISDSSAEILVQNKPLNSSVLVQPVSSKSSYSESQPSIDMKSFVFRLPEGKLEATNDFQVQNASDLVQSGFVKRTSQSVYGSSIAVPKIRGRGSSVLRRALSRNIANSSQNDIQSISAEDQISTCIPVHTVSTQHSENTLSQFKISSSNVPLTSQNMSSEFPPKINVFPSVNAACSTDKFPGLFVTSSEYFWKPNISVSLSESAQTLSSAVSSADQVITHTSSASIPFPTSVYGFTTQISCAQCDTRSKTDLLVSGMDFKSSCCHVATDISPSLGHSHVSSVSQADSVIVPPRAVTVPTSIFGFHSRPLTTPQTFPTSSVSSPTTVSPQSILGTTARSSATTAQCNTAKTPASGVQFAFPFANSLTVTTTSAALFVSTPVQTAATKGSSHFPLSDKELCNDDKKSLIAEISFNDNISSKMDIDCHDQIVDKEQPTLEETQFQKTSPPPVMESTPGLLLSSHNKSKEWYQKVSQKEKKIMMEVFCKWKRFAYRSKLKRRLQSQDISTPLSTKLSLEEQAYKYPIPHGCIPVDFQTRLKYLLNLEEIKIPRSIFPDVGRIKLENILRPVLPKALLESGRLEENMFWKLCISLPSESEGEKFSLQLYDWINATFFDDGNNAERMKLITTKTTLGEDYNLFTSVQRTVGLVKQIIKGVNGLLFFTPRSLSHCESALDRYQKLVQSSLSLFPLPLVIVVSNSQWVEVCHRWCTPDVQRKRLAAFKIIGPLSEEKRNVLEELTGCISWMAQQANPAPPFEKWPLREVLLTIMSDLWCSVRFTLSSRCSSGFQQHPDDLLSLYHDALKHLQRIIVNDQLHKYYVIAPELEDLAKHSLGNKFNEILLNNEECIKKVENAFPHLQLNVCLPPTELLSVESFCEAVCSYNPRLQTPVSHFLRSWKENDAIDWIYIVEELTEIHIRDTIGKFELKNLTVVLEKTGLQKFRMKPWFTHWLQNKLSPSEHAEDTIKDGDYSSSESDELPVSSNEENAPKQENPDEKLFLDFESMLNELEKLNKPKLNYKCKSNVCDISPPPLSETDDNKLDILESQLDYYANLLKE